MFFKLLAWWSPVRPVPVPWAVCHPAHHCCPGSGRMHPALLQEPLLAVLGVLPCVVWLLNGHQAQHTAPSSTTSALGSTLTFQPWTVGVEESSPDKHPQKLCRIVHLNFCPCKEMCCLQETQLTKENKRPYCTIFTSRSWAGIWSIKAIKKKSYRKLSSPIGSVHHQLLVKVLPGEASGL